MSTAAPPPPVSAEPEPPPRRSRRGFETLRDMVLSIALVGLVVLGVFWVVAWQRPEVQGPVRPDVDVAKLFADVRVTDPFPVLEPTGLSGQWEPTSAWFEPASVNSELDGGVLHVGYITPENSYAEVRETNGERKAAIAEWVDDGAAANETTIGGREWDVIESDETGKQGLVTTVAGTTLVVTGKADLAELQALASSLH